MINLDNYIEIYFATARKNSYKTDKEEMSNNYKPIQPPCIPHPNRF